LQRSDRPQQPPPITARRSSGSSRADNAVESTRSQNSTVSCRRSAAAGGSAAGGGTAPSCSAAIAFSSFNRGPSGMPRVARWASVSSGSTSASISFSRNAGS